MRTLLSRRSAQAEPVKGRPGPSEDDDDDDGDDNDGDNDDDGDDDDDDAFEDVGLAEDRLADIWSLSTLNMHGTAVTAPCFGAKW